jgi:xanthine dehydrogenase accessory factor
MPLFDKFRQYLEREQGVALATVISGPRGVGSKMLLTRDGLVEDDFQNRALAEQVEADLRRLLTEEQPYALLYQASGEEWEVFMDVYPPLPQVVIVGATDTAIVLTTFAKALGYSVIVTDARGAFARSERFPDADQVIKGWPQDVLPGLRLDEATYVVLLSHDPKFDEPTLECALPSAAPYIGAIGSRKTQRERFDRLREQGYTEEQLSRIHGPVGLDLGGRSPAEIALAIIAQITAVRYKKEAPFVVNTLQVAQSSQDFHL